MRILPIIVTLLLSVSSQAVGFTSEDLDTTIDIYNGSEKGTSVIVVTWPDKVVEKLVYRNDDIFKGSREYEKWFNDRYDAYKKR